MEKVPIKPLISKIAAPGFAARVAAIGVLLVALAAGSIYSFVGNKGADAAAMLAEQHRLELRFMAVLGDVENRRMDPAQAAATLRREVITQYSSATHGWLAMQEPGDDSHSEQWMAAWKERAAANERWIVTTAEWLEAPDEASLATQQAAERRAAQASARFHQIDGAPR